MDENTTSGASNGDDAYRELALRMLAARFGGGSTTEPRLLPAALPPDLPFALPIPDGARLLGTLLLGEPAASHVGAATVVLDTALLADEVIAFYQAKLPADGWSEEITPRRHGGFMPAGAERVASTSFDRGGQGPSLRIMCLPAPDEHITIQVVVAEQPAVSPQARRHLMERNPMDVLPPLPAPAGSSQMQGGGGTAGPDMAESNATVETDLDVPAIGAHYQALLERAGWTARGSGTSGPVAWGAWDFTDGAGEPWTAVFTAVQRPDAARRYHLWLRADYAGSNPEGRGGPRLLGQQAHTGWTTYGQMRGR